jgi:hypothetical protein
LNENPTDSEQSVDPKAAGSDVQEEHGEPVDIVLDTSSLRKDIEQQVTEQVQKMLEAQSLITKNAGGKGAKEVSEELKKREELAERLRANPKKEQWMVTIPGTTTKELTGHLRDFCNVSFITKGEPGDTVNIPYVTDFDFEILSSVGDAFSDSLGTVYATTTTTLKEAGGWTRIAYKDLEKINSNLLDQINQQFVRAALRAEDRIILEDLDGNTTNQLAGAIDRDTESTGTGKISATDVPQAIGKLLVAGKDVQPGECVAYLTPGAYAGLLEDIASSQPFAFATPQYLQTGKITELMGINIVVGHTWGIGPPRSGGTGTCYACFMGRWKRGVVLAPKRELLMEAEKDTRTRTQFLTGSHTIGLKVIHAKEFVRINTSQLEA